METGECGQGRISDDAGVVENFLELRGRGGASRSVPVPAFSDLAEFNRRAWPQFLLERERPQEALEAAQEMIAKSDYAMGRFAGQTLAGQADLAMNRLEDARSTLRLAEREMEELPAAVTKSLPDVGLLNLEIMLYEKN